MNFRVKYRRTRSKFENLSRSVVLTQFVKYMSDETPQNHWINTPKTPQSTGKLCHYNSQKKNSNIINCMQNAYIHDFMEISHELLLSSLVF